MNLDFKKKDNILIVSIFGEIDHHTSGELRSNIEKEFLSSNVNNIIFDFSNVTFMDSSGIGMIIGRYKYVKNFGGKVFVSNINSTFDKIFKLSGLYKIIKVYNSIDDAIIAIQEV